MLIFISLCLTSLNCSSKLAVECEECWRLSASGEGAGGGEEGRLCRDMAGRYSLWKASRAARPDSLARRLAVCCVLSL